MFNRARSILAAALKRAVVAFSRKSVPAHVDVPKEGEAPAKKRIPAGKQRSGTNGGVARDKRTAVKKRRIARNRLSHR